VVIHGLSVPASANCLTCISARQTNPRRIKIHAHLDRGLLPTIIVDDIAEILRESSSLHLAKTMYGNYLGTGVQPDVQTVEDAAMLR
jgi:hypothetical protein